MFIKKEITRKPKFYNYSYDYAEFANCYEINADVQSAEDILNAYYSACNITRDEAENYDAIKINLGDCQCEITQPLVFDKKAESGLPVVFSSNGNCLISGGKSFKGDFTPYKNGVFKLSLSDDINGFRQLYADGELCVRSCYPKKSDNYKNEYIEGKWLDKERAIELPCKIEATSSDLEIVIIEKWTCSVAKIKKTKVDNNKTVLYLNDESASLFFDEQRSTKMPKPLCRVMNSLDLLTEANEWYFDDETKTLFVKPQNGRNINDVLFTVPIAEKIIEVKTDSLYFENISFAYSNWNYPSIHGFAEVQGTRYIDKTVNGIVWSSPTAAVSVFSKDIHFDRCNIYNTGGAALSAYDGSGDFSITNSVIATTGAGGISVGSFDESVPSQQNIVIANNTVKGVGKSYLGGVAVLAGYTKNLVIDHNTIDDCGYTGISVGWGWGKANDMCNFKITNNRVTNIINNYLFDGAGLYLLGRQSSDEVNLISGNYLEGGNGYSGLYFDEYSNNYEAHDNVIMKGNKNGWFLLMHDVNFGLHNISVQNNLIETKKKKINSYRFKDGAERPYFKKSSPKRRGVAVKNNYTDKCKNFGVVRELIVKNSGVKNDKTVPKE